MYELLKQNKDLWNLFTSKEEYIPRQLDKYNGITYKNILEPKVSNFLIENGLVVEYPDNKKFAVCLTHDVDDVYPPLSHTVLSSLYSMKNLNFNELKNQLCWKYKGKKFSPYWNFKEIIKLEEKYEAKSSFYFIATDRDIRRFRYDIEDLGQELGSIIKVKIYIDSIFISVLIYYSVELALSACISKNIANNNNCNPISIVNTANNG